MMTVIATFLAIYAAPFLLVAFLPGWRTLLAVGALIGIPVVWAVWEINAALNDFEHDPGVGAVLTLIWVATFGLGLASGLVVRAITLLLRRRGKSLRFVLMATLIGFFVTPSAYAGLVWWGDWKRRMPSEACLGSTFHIQIAEASDAVPAAPLFSVVTTSRDRTGVYSFAIPNRLRALCGIASSSSATLHATALHISFEEMKRSRDRLVSTYCAGSPAAWIAPLCRNEPESYVGYPVEMSVYSPSEYDHRHMLASETYQQFLQSRDVAVAAGRPLSVARIGNFDVFSDRYWVASAGPWATRLAEPLMLDCYQSNQGLYCSATHEAPQGTQITYAFRTPRDEIEATVTVIENTMARVLSELSAR